MMTGGEGTHISLPAQTRGDAALRYDARVAGAMNRVLEAERAARSAITDCELKMQATLELARQQRRTILERARARIMALHARAARTLGERTAQILERHGEAPDPGAAPDANGARLKAAVESLVVRLTRPAEDGL